MHAVRTSQGSEAAMTPDSGDDMGTPEEVSRLYDEFIGHAHPPSEPPEGFGEWVRQLESGESNEHRIRDPAITRPKRLRP
jgi:hypothetical protein